ncbi:MAG: protein kinase [Polyangiaceae bacterium]
MGSSPVKRGQLLAGKYEVDEILGEGGMGVVVAARHKDLDQRVAVKFLLPEVAEHQEAAERFRREARAAVKITSEHVARVIDVGALEDGAPYMVMEFLDGNDLSDELRAGPLPVAEAVGYLLQACEAVAEAHAAGIIHRDLKPANLYLHRKADGSRIVKVLDFGISKSLPGSSMDDLALTSTAALIGSPLYMSPEQMHSAKNVDVRTDIWSLGAILYQLLSGRPPYVAESLPQLCSALLNEHPPPLRDLRKEVPAGLATVVMRALAKDRNDRYSSVAEFATNLAEFAPTMAIHVQRASRILSASEARLPGPATERTPMLAVEPALASSSGDAALHATVASEPAGAREGSGGNTMAPWGKTRDRELSQPPRARRRMLGAVAVGALVAGSVVAFGVARTTANGASGAPNQGEPQPAAPPAVSTSSLPEVAPEPAPVPSGSSQDQDDSDTVDAAVAAPAASAAAKAARPSVKPQVSKPKPASGTKPPAVPTQFGGRR